MFFSLALPPLCSLILEPILLILSFIPVLRRFLPPHDPFAPHSSAPIEGYYTRVYSPTTSSTLLLIFSSVPSANSRPHLLHFSLHRANDPPIVLDAFPADITTHSPTFMHADGVTEFSLITSTEDDTASGRFDVRRRGQRYTLASAATGLSVTVELTARTPWIPGNAISSPEGARLSRMVRLLPLHWNVLSTCSHATYNVSRHGKPVERGEGWAHTEKNWGASFPSAWLWLQGFAADPDAAADAPRKDVRTFACAGGQILGQKAYLLGYRSAATGTEWSFKPPWTLMPLGIPTPFFSEHVDAERGLMVIDVAGFTRRLRVVAQVPKDAKWIKLHCPMSDGHANKAAQESFDATIIVTAMRRDWWMGGLWRPVEETVFENAAMEFGGGYRAGRDKDE